jgi:DNA modification methylase
MSVRVIHGDCRDVLATLPAGSVHCVVTSPPYWGLRDYGIPPSVWGGDVACEHEWGDLLLPRPGRGNKPGDVSTSSLTNPERQDTLPRAADNGAFCRHCGAWRGAFGLEPSFDLYVQHAVEIFREVRRVLRPDGSLWLNIGDSYCSANENRRSGLKHKDLCGIPWRVAFALQADGWWLRQDIIWSKRAPMPESVSDRCTKSHEYLFLLSKSARYYFDAEAIKEDCDGGNLRMSRAEVERIKAEREAGANTNVGGGVGPKATKPDGRTRFNKSFQNAVCLPVTSRNKRSVWEVATQPFSEWAYDFSGAHYVDDHGIPRKLSPDCPVHGRSEGLPRGFREDDACGEQPDVQSSCNQHTENDRVAEPAAGSVPIRNYTAKPLEGMLQPSGNAARISENRTSDVLKGEPETTSRTPGIQKESCPLSNSDSPLPACSQTATSHSNQNCKTGLSDSSLQGDTPCEESAGGTPRTLLELFSSEPNESNGGSKSGERPCSENGSQSAPSASASRKSRSQIRRSSTQAKCTCPVSQVSHFATFPPALIEPCILAGTSAKGCCGKCGAPWVRLIAKDTKFRGGSGAAGRSVDDVNAAGKWAGKQHGKNIKLGPVVSTSTTGWSPSCQCNELACTVCSFVLDQPHEERSSSTIHIMSDVREVVPPVEEARPVLFSQVLRAETEHASENNLQTVRHGNPTDESSPTVLRQVLRDEVDSESSAGLQGRADTEQPRLFPDPQAGSSECAEIGLHHGAPISDGRETGPSIAGSRDCPSHQREQEGQPAAKSGADRKQQRPRQNAQTHVSCDLPEMQPRVSDAGPCPCCGGRLVRRPLPTKPATVLDCFGGSGTAGLVADRLQRDAVLIELNSDYVAMARRRIFGDAPLFEAVQRDV